MNGGWSQAVFTAISAECPLTPRFRTKEPDSSARAPHQRLHSAPSLGGRLASVAHKVAPWLHPRTEHHFGRSAMMRLCLAISLSLFAASTVIAQDGAACAAKAVSKDGKALAGAAKASSIKKCCEAGAVGKDGKNLAGAAKASFMKKCEAGT